jgi:hypothetical protein
VGEGRRRLKSSCQSVWRPIAEVQS